MKKEQKKFYDAYDELFVMPKKEKKKRQIKEKKKPKISFNKIKINKGTVAIIVFFVVLLLLPLLKKTTVNISHQQPKSEDFYEEKYNEVTPLITEEIRPASEQDIDKNKPLHIKLEDKKLMTNRGYQITIKGKTEVDGSGEREWSILPDLKAYSENKTIVNISFYDKGIYSMSSTISIYANMTDFSRNINNRDESFLKAYPLKDYEDVQTGYALECNATKSDVYSIIYKYYIFSDGTGMLICFETGATTNNNLTRYSTYQEFRKAYREELEKLDNTYEFSKIDDQTKVNK